jgi:hypothetical protein
VRSRAAWLLTTALALLIGLAIVQVTTSVVERVPPPMTPAVIAEAHRYLPFTADIDTNVATRCSLAAELPSVLKGGPLATCATVVPPHVVVARLRARSLHPVGVTYARMRLPHPCSAWPACPTVTRDGWIVQVSDRYVQGVGGFAGSDPGCGAGATLVVVDGRTGERMGTIAWGRAAAGVPNCFQTWQVADSQTDGRTSTDGQWYFSKTRI